MASTNEPGKDLAVFNPNESKFPVLFEDSETGGGLAQLLEDNFGDEGFSPSDLDRLKVPAGGGQFWELPDDDPAKVIEGVVIHKQPTRSFWFKKRGEDGEEDGPPDCYSADAKIGVGVFGPGSKDNPTGECAECPMNVFGSSTAGSGTGKACKEQMQVFMLQEGSVLPVQVSLPPTSLRGWKKYMTRLASKGKPFYSVVTQLGLTKTSSNGQTYSVVEPARLQDLDPVEAMAARSYGQTIRSSLDAAAEARARNEDLEREKSEATGAPEKG